MSSRPPRNCSTEQRRAARSGGPEVRTTGACCARPRQCRRRRSTLRIIYGPDYTESLEVLRDRHLGRKRQLARREHGLGLEALTGFINHEPLSKVHQSVFAVLALESEPVDPPL
ncbi:MAG: hypothetical protein J2P28_12295 [Actinobacteria bacterium]|nr:hypothetical protein [Actinomycetota bacterium]MBO0836267.1 hypothetical protein [Actinomycetota bacterium]